MLKKSGRLYLSTVIGPQRIEFDAHRVFSIQYLIDLLDKNFSTELSDENIISNFDCNYGCGIFELIKK